MQRGLPVQSNFDKNCPELGQSFAHMHFFYNFLEKNMISATFNSLMQTII